MSTSHGSKATLFTGTNASPETVTQDMHQFANSFGLPFSRDTAETTTMALGSKQYIPGLKDATMPYEGPFDSAADVVLWPLFDNGTVINFEYAPAGRGAAGTPLYTGTMFISSYEVSSEVGDANAMSCEFQVTGDVAREVQP